MAIMSNDKSNIIDNKPLRERIADVLRHSILTAELKPGETIVESVFADQFGVSRAPLREALQILNAEGLIELIPYHKTMVRRLTRADIEELYSLRNTLEAFAIKRIIQNTPLDIEPLDICCAKMVDAALANDAQLVSVFDHQFHDTLITLSNHNLLISMWSSVSQRVHQVLALRDMRRKDIEAMARSHIPIIDAIRSRDLPLATNLIEIHIETASDLIVDLWDEETYGDLQDNN